MAQTVPAEAARSRRPDELAVVDPSRCVGCSYCKLACPFDVITVAHGRATIAESCPACWVCLKYCPVDAISKAKR